MDTFEITEDTECAECEDNIEDRDDAVVEYAGNDPFNPEKVAYCSIGCSLSGVMDGA